MEILIAFFGGVALFVVAGFAKHILLDGKKPQAVLNK